MTGTRSVTVMTRRSGQSFVTVADATWGIASTRRVTAPASTRSSGVPGDTSAATMTCPGMSRWVPVTVTDRTTSTRLPSSAQPDPATIASPASTKKAVRQRDRGRRRPRGTGAPGSVPPGTRPPGSAAGAVPAGAGGGPSLMRTPRWRSESAFADALYLPIRSQARSSGALSCLPEPGYLGEHQRADPGDVARAHGEHQVTGCGQRGDGLGYVREVRDVVRAAGYRLRHEAAGHPGLGILARRVDVEHHGLVRQAERGAERGGEDAGPAVQVGLEDGDDPAGAARARDA